MGELTFMLIALTMLLLMFFLAFYMTFNFSREITASFTRLQEKFREMQEQAFR